MKAAFAIGLFIVLVVFALTMGGVCNFLTIPFDSTKTFDQHGAQFVVLIFGAALLGGFALFSAGRQYLDDHWDDGIEEIRAEQQRLATADTRDRQSRLAQINKMRDAEGLPRIDRL